MNRPLGLGFANLGALLMSMGQALIKLGYTPEHVEMIVSHIDSTGTIEGAPGLKDEHLPVFDCSFRPQNGKRFIQHMGHVRMMAAVQPFVSGAISTTIKVVFRPIRHKLPDELGARNGGTRSRREA